MTMPSKCEGCTCADCEKRSEALPKGICGRCDICERNRKRERLETFCAWKKEGLP